MATQLQGDRHADRRVAEGAEALTVMPISTFTTDEQEHADLLGAVISSEARVRSILEVLERGGADAYHRALEALGANRREWWAEAQRGDAPGTHGLEECFTQNLAGLTYFLNDHVLPLYAERRRQLENRDLIRNQAIGEALPVGRLEVLARYETHLDRKLERALSMLLRLQEIRREKELVQSV